MKNITCKIFKETYENNKNNFLLDVRSEEEFNDGHIEGAVNLPMQLLQQKAKDIIPSLSTPVITCCLSGGRSLISAVALEDLGYTNVMNLEGGYNKYCLEK